MRDDRAPWAPPPTTLDPIDEETGTSDSHTPPKDKIHAWAMARVELAKVSVQHQTAMAAQELESWADGAPDGERGRRPAAKHGQFSRVSGNEADDILGDDDDDFMEASRAGAGRKRICCGVALTMVGIVVILLASSVRGSRDSAAAVSPARDISANASMALSSPPPVAPSPHPPQSPSPPPPDVPPPTLPSPMPATPPAAPPPAETALFVSVLPAKYQQAKERCERQGGRLATPRDADENAALNTLLVQRGVVDRMWLGGTDLGHEGRWMRLDGYGRGVAEVPMTYTNWGHGQPDGNTNENCIEIWLNGEWNDAPCSHDKAYVCEVPQPPRDLTFPCSPGVLSKLTASGHHHVANPQCKHVVFGADGNEFSTLKQEFSECTQLCRALGSSAQIAEPRTSDQLQSLARTMRASGDDSMWMGLTPVNPSRWGPGDEGWMWLGSGTDLTPAQSSWAPGQPGTEGQCVSLWTDGTWNVRGCGGDSRAIKVCPCETLVED